MSMPRLTVVQHAPTEGPGRLRTWADARGIDLDVRPADQAFKEPADGLALLGGPESVADPSPRLRHEIEAVRDVLARRPQLPVLGICLGAQILASALGAEVAPIGFVEAGWAWIDANTPTARFRALQWHADGFALPPGAARIATGERWREQGFRLGPVVGLQFHPEWDPATRRELAAAGDMPFDVEAPERFDVEVDLWFTALLDRWAVALRR
ncbi:type 1 glutamine amidotransferase [Lysobacter humi (ex Lee et al. 2017)]